MSLAQLIQDAWNRQAKWLVVLRPLSWLYHVGFAVNKSLYRMRLKKAYTAPVPVMVIGNITVGGSGKTPLLIELVKYLQSQDVRVAVISRGYGGEGPFPALVSLDSEPNQVGDEPCLIVQATQVPMAVGSNRRESIELLLSSSAEPIDLIISDDGLQHWSLSRQLEWIVLDQNRGLGNERLLPEGYLREPKSRLLTGTVIEHASEPQTALSMHLQAVEPYLLNARVDQVVEWFNPDLDYYAVVGIGFPQRFYRTLESMGVTHFQCHEFADHYDYEINDLAFEDANPIITTEKDAVKLLPLLKKNPDFKRQIWVVPVDAVLSEACYSLFNRQLKQLGIQVE